ncbi:MAG: tripartite tricarboxylate transporter substrate binding protein [Sphaerochaetaceae bacterium]
MKKILLVSLVFLSSFSLLFAGGQAEGTTPTVGTVEQTADGKVAKPAGYPGGVITWIVPSSAGGATDLFTRALGDAGLGGNVVVQNISGGSQSIGISQAFANPADGRTLLTVPTTGLITMPITTDVVYSSKDFRYVAKIAPDCVGVAVTRPGSPIDNGDKFWALIHSGKQFSVGVSSIGGHSHIEFAHALDQIGAYDDAKFVVYSGSNGVMQAVLSGEVDFGLLDDNYIPPYVKNNQLNAVMTTWSDRTPLLPDVKCLGEYGVTGLEPLIGVKLLAVKKGTPDNVIAWIKQQVNNAVISDEYQQFLTASGAGHMDRVWSEEELTKWVDDASVLWRSVLTKTGLVK